MRDRLWLSAVILLLLAGCAGPEPDPSAAARTFPGLDELGKPWPVLIGSYAGSLSIVRHGPERLLFETAGGIRHQLDYGRRKLAHLGLETAAERSGRTRRPVLRAAGDPARLYLEWPDGQRTEITGKLASSDGFALSRDGKCAVFYEESPAGVDLVQYDPQTDARRIWRRLGQTPEIPALSWSPDDRHVLEDLGDRLLLINRESGRSLGPIAGEKPLFDPAGRYLLFERPDRYPGLLDLQTGEEWPLLSAKEKWRPPYRGTWRRDGTAILLRTASEESGRHLLHLYEIGSGKSYRYETAYPVDLQRYAALLDAPPDRLRPPLDLLPKLERGPLTALDGAGFLAGQGERLVFLDAHGSLHELARFPARILALSLARDGRRLAITTGRAKQSALYAWRLPDPAILAGLFPDERDRGLGPLQLGMSEAEVAKALGPPLQKEAGTDPRHGGGRITTWRYPDLAAVFSAQKLLIRLVSSSPSLLTGRGLGLGARQAEIFESYGRPAYRTDGYLSYQGEVDGTRIKVAFILDQAKKAAAVLVAKVD